MFGTTACTETAPVGLIPYSSTRQSILGQSTLSGVNTSTNTASGLPKMSNDNVRDPPLPVARGRPVSEALLNEKVRVGEILSGLVSKT